MNLKAKTSRYLLRGLAGLLLLCLAVFGCLVTLMLQLSNRTLNQVGELYMGEMNRQMQLHFESLVNLQLDQVEGLVLRTPTESIPTYGEQLQQELTDGAAERGFPYLALYSAQGNEYVICGESVSLHSKDAFLTSLNNDEKKVASGTTASGEDLFLFGVSVGYPQSVGYPLPDGEHCTALVAGLPLDTITQTLSLGVDESFVFSHIIEKNGAYIVESGGLSSGSFYDWVLSCRFSGADPQEIVRQMQEAFAEGQPYAVAAEVDSQQRHLYCSALPYSDWVLVTIMPRGPLDEAIGALGSRQTLAALCGCAVLVLALLLIFWGYYRRSQQQLKELEKAHWEAKRASQAKSEFLSNMSHDIRTPMNAIVGMTAIATAHIDSPAQVQDCLKKISLSSRHLLGLINDVLDMSKIESGKLSLNIAPLSLRETMESIVSIVQPQAKSKQLRFDIIVQNIQAEQLLCDGVRLNQVLLNLLSNALKFTPEGGSVTVTVCQQDSPRGANWVRTLFEVKDTGIGMSAEFQKKIFDSFEREDSRRVQKIEGTGLGMAITKYIVDMMQGEITVTSAPDKGSCFVVSLDLERIPEELPDRPLPAWELLVVDDDEQLCRSAADALREIGLQPEWVQDGAQAVEMVCRRHAAHRDYHMVLLDWQMPGMDGIQTAREIRRAVGDGVPILLISAYDWSEIEEEARSAGVSGFLSKPLFRSTLYYGLQKFADPAVAEKAAARREGPLYAGRRLLLAEDNDLNWEIANELLSAQGFVLDHAENGKSCVEQFLASAPGWYDAVLMDLRMPVMDGYEATRHIRAAAREDALRIPIIAMTADVFSEDIQHCLDCGMNAHISKPIDLPELLRLLQRYLADADAAKAGGPEKEGGADR